MIGLRGVGEGWLLREMRIDFDQASSIVFVLEWNWRWLLSRLSFSSLSALIPVYAVLIPLIVSTTQQLYPAITPNPHTSS